MIDNFHLKSPIITERLCIKKITADELLLIKAETNYDETNKMTCRPIIERKGNELGEFYNQIIKKENNLIFSIWRKQNEELVGKVSFNDYNPRNRSMELGYYMIPRFRKYGYMREALKSLFDILFKKMELNKIYAQTGSFNIESIQLLENMGFKKDGALRNHHELNDIFYDDYIYSILTKEWNDRS
ncbi:GNAT family N-acetyltransferase [Lacrimispora sp. AGF001]|uniref:GNAT family N-acetyltransferase n=1 Tax=Lacrimispora sp. AGF001 TaxID=3401631 RepID=UPI003B42C899